MSILLCLHFLIYQFLHPLPDFVLALFLKSRCHMPIAERKLCAIYLVLFFAGQLADCSITK